MAYFSISFAVSVEIPDDPTPGGPEEKLVVEARMNEIAANRCGTSESDVIRTYKAYELHHHYGNMRKSVV